MEENKETIISPAEYFEKLKGAKQTITSEGLKESYGVILSLAEKYKKTGQIRSLKKLQYLTSILGEEEKLVDLGVNTFVYKSDIEDYIDNIPGNVVKVIELENYLREIPDEIVEVVEKTKDIFSKFYVVFTDYTGKEERRVSKERREKDPILFGCFRDSEFVADRFYFLGDWEDQYCDLTLDRLVAEYKDKKNQDPTHRIEIPQTLDELREFIGDYNLDPRNNNRWVINNNISLPILDRVQNRKKSFFGKIRSIFKR